MPKHPDNFHDRMKSYEEEQDSILKYKGQDSYTIIRLDGKNFSKFTKKFKQPFDDGLADILLECGQKLLQKIDGSKFGYIQSDEVSIIIPPLQPKSQLWFGGRIQKIVSVAASQFTANFNKCLPDEVNHATFDARIFQITTLDEVINYLRWRQRDSYRNYIQKLAQYNFGHKVTKNKKCSELAPLLFDYKNTIPDTKFAYGKFFTKFSEKYLTLNQISFNEAKSEIECFLLY